MTFDAKYSLPPREFGPSVDFYPNAEDRTLFYSWRIFPCECGKRTGWRALRGRYSIPVCSEECLAGLPALSQEDFELPAQSVVEVVDASGSQVA